MRSMKLTGIIVLGACVALAGTAGAQSKGSGKSSITIVKVPAPPGPTPKTAGSVSSKASASVAGKPPTGGGSFAMKLAKDVGDPLKPGFLDGDYVLEIESAPTADGDLVGNALAAAFFITFNISGGKCTIKNNPDFDPGSPNCGGMMQPECAAPEGLGKCSANLYQVTVTLLDITLNANDPFSGRFRIRTNPTPALCKTGHLLIEATGLSPLTSTCRTGTVVGVGGVALGSLAP
jgi:hypothetical protein